MCSCSGSCNCNSTTIPRGPQGVPGTNGSDGGIGPIGPQGPVGSVGPNGLNAFTTLTNDFIQPNVGENRTIYVADATWVAIDSIIFVERNSITDAGGYYQVISASTISSSIVVQNLGWTTAGVTYVSPGYTVGNIGTLVVAGGIKGADGTSGLDGFPGSYIQEAFWGIESGSGGTDDYKYGILVPEDSLINDYDTLECQTIICINADSSSLGRLVEIKVSTTNDNDGVNAMVFEIPNTVTSGKPVTYAHINYKIQRISNTTFRSTGECFVGDEAVSATLLTQTSSNNYICTSTSAITLDNSSNWGNNQYIVVVANDTATPDISVRHHEVKVTRIKI